MPEQVSLAMSHYKWAWARDARAPTGRPGPGPVSLRVAIARASEPTLLYK